tara:strand:- start:221 stop:706 length:486 start_codon:yes stop_codon:yes gene_type:complete
MTKQHIRVRIEAGGTGAFIFKKKNHWHLTEFITYCKNLELIPTDWQPTATPNLRTEHAIRMCMEGVLAEFAGRNKDLFTPLKEDENEILVPPSVFIELEKTDLIMRNNMSKMLEIIRELVRGRSIIFFIVGGSPQLWDDLDSGALEAAAEKYYSWKMRILK